MEIHLCSIRLKGWPEEEVEEEEEEEEGVSLNYLDDV